MHGRPRHAPPWWPANEPWPPANPRHAWRRGRSRFLRRAGCLVGGLLVLSAIGAITLVSIVLGRAGMSNPSSQLSVLLVIVAIAGLVLLATFVGVMRRLGTPFGDIVEAADRVASGDFSTRVVERGPPPLRSVARAFNSMTGRLQSQDQQRRNLMADIAHELRTPLAIIQGRLEGLLDGVYPRDDERLGEVLEDTRILGRLIEDLRTLTNAESGSLSLQKEPTDLAILIQDVATSFSGEASASHLTIRLGGATDLPLLDVDPLRMREVLANVVSNALRHTPKDGIISVAADTDADRVVIRVSDTGSGIAADELPKIFDRFYKGQTSKGSGLGLTIARNLVIAHGGEIRATSKPGEGTTITINLPLEHS